MFLRADCKVRFCHFTNAAFLLNFCSFESDSADVSLHFASPAGSGWIKEYLDEPKNGMHAKVMVKLWLTFGPTEFRIFANIYYFTCWMYFVICPAVVGRKFPDTLDSSAASDFHRIIPCRMVCRITMDTNLYVLHALRTPRKYHLFKAMQHFAMFVITTLEIIVRFWSFLLQSFGTELGLMPLPGNYWLWLFASQSSLIWRL